MKEAASGERAQPVSLSYKQEGLSLVPRTHRNAVVLALERQRQQRQRWSPGLHWLASLT